MTKKFYFNSFIQTPSDSDLVRPINKIQYIRGPFNIKVPYDLIQLISGPVPLIGKK